MHNARLMQSQQRGLSMIGFLFVILVLFFLGTLGMKLVPAYIEYYAVEKILNTMGQNNGIASSSNAEIREEFRKRAGVDDVTAVKPTDIDIDRRGGSTVISTDYEFRTSLFGNVSLVAHFSASSDPNAAASPIE
ncbi:MAG: DUF4845 domain-containing protein [Thiobacillus sp.]